MAKLRWLGHAAFILELAGWKIAIDPWITNPLSPYRSLDKFYKEYPEIDLIIVTHDHGDHLGEAIDISKKFGAPIITTFELANNLSQKGAKTIGANIGGPIKLEDIDVILTPATHSSTLGAPTGAIIRGKESTIYHAGDTGLFGGMQLLGNLYKIDIALLPIGGHFTMGPYEAAWATKLLQPKVVIPMHYGTFPIISGSPDELRGHLESMNINVKLVVLNPGESFTF